MVDPFDHGMFGKQETVLKNKTSNSSRNPEVLMAEAARGWVLYIWGM